MQTSRSLRQFAGISAKASQWEAQAQWDDGTGLHSKLDRPYRCRVAESGLTTVGLTDALRNQTTLSFRIRSDRQGVTIARRNTSYVSIMIYLSSRSGRCIYRPLMTSDSLLPATDVCRRH